MEERRNEDSQERTPGEQEIEGDDPITGREELELELMDEGESEKGADIGEHID